PGATSRHTECVLPHWPAKAVFLARDGRQDRLRDVVRLRGIAEARREYLAIAAHDGLVGRRLVVAGRRGGVLEDVRHDHPGLDVDHADAKAAYLVGERFAGTLQGPLRGGVSDLVRGRDEPGNRSDVHDGAPA